jgi:hypothetical protein
LWLDPRFAALERSPLAPGQSWFYDSPLLLEGLTRTTVADEALATLLTQIRREILLSSVSGDAELLRAQAADSRAAQSRRLMESAGRKDVSMLIPVVFLILPTVVVIALFPGFRSLHLFIN